MSATVVTVHCPKPRSDVLPVLRVESCSKWLQMSQVSETIRFEDKEATHWNTLSLRPEALATIPDRMQLEVLTTLSGDITYRFQCTSVTVTGIGHPHLVLAVTPKLHLSDFPHWTGHPYGQVLVKCHHFEKYVILHMRGVERMTSWALPLTCAVIQYTHLCLKKAFLQDLTRKFIFHYKLS